MNNTKTSTGIILAILATLIWSGNFIIARGVIKTIPPVSLAFFRWSTAVVLLLPIAWTHLGKDLRVLKTHWVPLLFTALMGVSLYNTFIYISGHYSEAINLALLATTSSPIMTVILARIFLKERIPPQRIIGMSICVIGILLLLSKGNPATLYHFTFSKGDWWALASAFCFAVYNIMVRRTKVDIRPTSFLFIVFTLGTLLLLPFYLYEFNQQGGFELTWNNAGVILYLGLGACVISYLLWNRAIQYLGAATTALFGNLIPVFSTLEAVWILGEKIRWFHIAGFALVILGLALSNYRKKPN